MYHVTWLLNLLEAMEFVSILSMCMRLTTFLFTPEGNKIKKHYGWTLLVWIHCYFKLRTICLRFALQSFIIGYSNSPISNCLSVTWEFEIARLNCIKISIAQCSHWRLLTPWPCIVTSSNQQSQVLKYFESRLGYLRWSNCLTSLLLSACNLKKQ